MPNKTPIKNSRLPRKASFTDRKQPQHYFQQALAEIEQRQYSLLNFYGVGGIGKTHLHEHLQQAHLDKDSSCLYSWVDFSLPDQRSLNKTLRTLVQNFTGEDKIAFTAFGLAYMIYWETAFPDQEIKKAGLPFLEEGSLLAAAVDMAESVGGFASMAVGAMSYLYGKVKENAFDSELRDALNRLTNLRMDEIEDQLGRFFAYDIEQYQLQHPDNKIVLFIDTHEALWVDKRTEANRLSQDQWLRDDLIAQLPWVLFVISGRERIIWDEIPDDNWGQFLHQRQHLLGKLSDDDTRDFLISGDIMQEAIQDRIIADSKGVPFYLDLCIETYDRIEQRGKMPSVADFAAVGSQHQLFERFTRYLDRTELETLKVLAHTQSYNAALFTLLVDKFQTGYPISALSQLHQFSFINQQQQQFQLHDLMQKSLLDAQQQSAPERSEAIYQFLFDDYNAQLQDLTLNQLTDTHLKALLAAFYYKTRLVGAKELVDWFITPRNIFTDAAYYKPLLALDLQLQHIVDNELGQMHLYSSDVLHHLAYLYEKTGQYKQAVPLLQNSLAIREQALENDHPDVAASLNNLAELYQSQGKYDQAEPLYQRSLAIREQVLGKDHPEVATSLNNLAGLYNSQGKYQQAEPLYQRSLAIGEQALGKDHPDVATSLNNLAGLYESQGKYQQAEPLYQRSLVIWEQALGKDHPDVATSLNNLALLYKSQGKYEQAEPLYQRSLAIREQVLGKDHPNVATSLNNLAGLYESQGKYDQAEPLYQHSLAIREQALGKDHPAVAASLNNLALLYNSQGKYDQAEPLYQRSLAISEQALGKDHPEVATSLNNLAGLYYAQQHYNQALPLFEQALAILKGVFPNGHPNIEVMQENIEILKGKME